jgi:hypothetical protein
MIVKLKRPNAWKDKMVSYKIFIDNQYVGIIANDEVKEFTVSEGDHAIYAKCQFMGSNRLNFKASTDPVELSVMGAKNTMWWVALFGVFYYIFKRDSYLVIT